MVASSTAKINIRPPDYGVLPRWMGPAVRRAIKAGRLPALSQRESGHPWSLMIHAAHATGGTSWIDHEGRLIEDDGEHVLTSEPYQLLPCGLRQLTAFCRALELTYLIEPRGWWREGRTLRILVRQAHGRGQEVGR